MCDQLVPEDERERLFLERLDRRHRGGLDRASSRVARGHGDHEVSGHVGQREHGVEGKRGRTASGRDRMELVGIKGREREASIELDEREWRHRRDRRAERGGRRTIVEPDPTTPDQHHQEREPHHRILPRQEHQSDDHQGRGHRDRRHQPGEGQAIAPRGRGRLIGAELAAEVVDVAVEQVLGPADAIERRAVPSADERAIDTARRGRELRPSAIFSQ